MAAEDYVPDLRQHIVLSREQYLQLASLANGVPRSILDEDDGYPDEDDAEPLNTSQPNQSAEARITRSVANRNADTMKSASTNSRGYISLDSDEEHNDDSSADPQESNELTRGGKKLDGRTSDSTRNKKNEVKGPFSTDQSRQADLTKDRQSDLTKNRQPELKHDKHSAEFIASNGEESQFHSKSAAIEDTRARYKTVRQNNGLYQLSATALKDERTVYDTLLGTDIVQMYCLGYTVLVSTHPTILDCVLKGNVAQRYHADPEFRELLDKIKTHGESRTRPAVYLNQIGDEKGRMPTPNQLLAIIPKLFDYVYGRDAQYIAKIDRMHSTSRTKRASNDRQFRKYMYSGNKLSITRQENTVVFLQALEARCLAVDESARDDPLPGWLPEFGYTHTTETRLRNHREHRSSNYIMNLIDSALNLEWPQTFKVHQFVIFLCIEPAQAVLSEVIFTRIGIGYIGNGGGFTHYPPGLSNQSARWYQTDEWEKWFEWSTDVCGTDDNDQKESELWVASESKRMKLLYRLNYLKDEIKRVDAILPDEVTGLSKDASLADILQLHDELLRRRDKQRAEINKLKADFLSRAQQLSALVQQLRGEKGDSGDSALGGDGE